jgi:hypothetical protein
MARSAAPILHNITSLYYMREVCQDRLRTMNNSKGQIVP